MISNIYMYAIAIECDENAELTISDGLPHCKCFEGFYGNGYKCVGKLVYSLILIVDLQCWLLVFVHHNNVFWLISN